MISVKAAGADLGTEFDPGKVMGFLFHALATNLRGRFALKLGEPVAGSLGIVVRLVKMDKDPRLVRCFLTLGLEGYVINGAGASVPFSLQRRNEIGRFSGRGLDRLKISAYVLAGEITNYPVFSKGSQERYGDYVGRALLAKKPRDQILDQLKLGNLPEEDAVHILKRALGKKRTEAIVLTVLSAMATLLTGYVSWASFEMSRNTPGCPYIVYTGGMALGTVGFITGLSRILKMR
jgi:hypothetical protein